jgi:hypothetical protein
MTDTTEARAARVAGELTKAQRKALLDGAFVVRGQADYRNGRLAIRADKRVRYNLCLRKMLTDYIGTPLLTPLGLLVRKHLENGAMNHEIVEVTQEDRNAVVRLLEAGDQDWQAKEVRLGQGDHFPIVQAFARHRQAALTAARPAILEEAAGIAEGYNFGPVRDDRDSARNATAQIIATALRAAVKP